MSDTVRIRRRLESDTPYLPELRELVGRDVEILVREVSPAAPERYPLRGSVRRFDDPFEPLHEDDWEALG